MMGLSIGDVARKSGLAASAIRYYERVGLIPPPTRSSRRRRYDPQILGRIGIIQLARAAGFTLAELRIFLTGFSEGTPPAARWRVLAEKKLVELNETMERIDQMKKVLESTFRCRCTRLEECERFMARLNKGCSVPPKSIVRARGFD